MNVLNAAANPKDTQTIAISDCGLPKPTVPLHVHLTPETILRSIVEVEGFHPLTC